MAERNLPSTPIPRRFLLRKPVLGDYVQKRVSHSGLPGYWDEPLGISCTKLSFELGKSDSKRRARRRKYECLLCTRHLHSCSILLKTRRAGSYYHLHFIGMETEAQSGEVTCPRSNSSIGTARSVNPTPRRCPPLHSHLWECFSSGEISPLPPKKSSSLRPSDFPGSWGLTTPWAPY